MSNISTPSYVALAGIVVSILAHFNIVVPQDGIVAILAGAVALYSVCHQIFAHKKAIALGKIHV